MRWEYKVHAFDSKHFLSGKFKWEDFEGDLNRMGREGWELVSTLDTNSYRGSTGSVVALFKRSI